MDRLAQDLLDLYNEIVQEQPILLDTMLSDTPKEVQEWFSYTKELACLHENARLVLKDKIHIWLDFDSFSQKMIGISLGIYRKSEGDYAILDWYVGFKKDLPTIVKYLIPMWRELYG